MSLRTRRIAWVAGPVILLGSIVGGAFVGASLVGGGTEEVSPSLGDLATVTPTPDFTPPHVSPYPTRDPSLPTQPPDTAGPFPVYPDSVEISGVSIPIPEGSHYLCCGGPEERRHHQIWMGDSNYEQTESGGVALGVQFDEFGLLYANVAPSQEATFAPTLDALWALTQQVATPSPSFVSVKGQSIPLPQDSYYVTEDTGRESDPLVYIVRLGHSAFMFDGYGQFNVSVRPEDSAGLTTTFAALDSLSLVD